MFMLAATSEAPNDSRYDASARGLVITSTKRDQSMPAALSTSAASGISTMAHRKNVVNPSVIPKPGMTLGSRWPTLHAAISGSRRAARDLGRPVDDEHRPARLRGQQAAIGRAGLRDVGDAEHQHLRGARRQIARDLGDGLADGELGAHLEAVTLLRFGARVEQLAHRRRRARAPARPSGTMPRYTASADTWRSRLADTASVARRTASSVQWMIHARRARRIARQHQHFGCAMLQQPFHRGRGVVAAGNGRHARERRRRAGRARRWRADRRGSSCAWRGFRAAARAPAPRLRPRWARRPGSSTSAWAARAGGARRAPPARRRAAAGRAARAACA